MDEKFKEWDKILEKIKILKIKKIFDKITKKSPLEKYTKKREIDPFNEENW